MQYILEFEGVENPSTLIPDEFDELLQNFSPFNGESSHLYETELGVIDGFHAVAILNDQSIKHALTKEDIFKIREPIQNTKSDFDDRKIDHLAKDGAVVVTASYTFQNRYSETQFQGIMPDTGAAGVSTAGFAQFKALKNLKNIQLDRSRAGQAKIKFGIGLASSIGTTDVVTPVGLITFHVLPSNTPFLLCIHDMDKTGTYLNNIENVLVQGDKRIPIVRKFGHPWILLDKLEETMAYCHLTETQLRQLHRRFGHPSVQRFNQVLKRSGHDVDVSVLEYLTKYCHECQIHSKSPGRFKFTLKDDHEFNYSVFVDVMYIDGSPLLHVVDESTRFQAARWLKNMTAQHTWDSFRTCWVDVYIGPPDVIVHDAGTNFASKEFRQLASSMAIITKEVPVEAHNSVGLVERYHGPLKRAYEIIKHELKEASIDKNMMLQMAIKSVNDTAGPNGIVPTLLVFGSYPRMVEMDPPAPSITVRAAAIRAATKEVRELYAKRQVNDALGMRNGPRHLMDLPLNSQVLVWREKEGWTGPHSTLR